MKLSNSPAITQHREVPVPRRQDVDERPCVPRLELDHFESQPDSPRINQRFLNLVIRNWLVDGENNRVITQGVNR